MSWTVSTWVAAALLALCTGQSSRQEGNWPPSTGYHLCTRNESRNVSFLVVQKVPYTVTKPCDGWLLWKQCTVTATRLVPQTEYKTVWEQVSRCCDGYEQAGRYCVLPVNRSGEFTAKLGSCPTVEGSAPGSEEDCESDVNCPGRKKCCQLSGRPLCIDPASSSSYPENGGNRLNATVTVKTDYQQLMSENHGLLNHLRLLQSLVSGALQSKVTVYYLQSWPVHPYRTSTSLLIHYSSPLSPHNVTSKLHLLLKHIPEVSSVTVQDVDECAHSALRRCSPQALCNNTMGSYWCACRHGYVDVDPRNPGANCTADVNGSIPTEPPMTDRPPMNTTHAAASTSPQEPTGESFQSSESNMTTPRSNTSSVPYNSSHAPPWASSAPHNSTSSSVETSQPTCPPPSINALWATNVTGSSFSVCWSSHLQTNQTYLVSVSEEFEVVFSRESDQNMMAVKLLKPGVLYNVTVTPCTCGKPGLSHHVFVKTDARALDATVRFTNIQFTADLHNTSSQAYKNLTRDIKEEIYQSLSPDMRTMVDSGQVRIEITGFSQGSVVVNFTVVFTPTQSQNITAVSNALLDSLMNSSIYTVDENNTSIYDFDECASGDNDCSQWAACANIWASYTCTCWDGFIDDDPERPGRACRATATAKSTTPELMVHVSPTTQMIPLTSGPTTNTANTVSETISSTLPKNVSGSTTAPALTTTPSVPANTTITTNNTTLIISTTAQISNNASTINTFPPTNTNGTAPTMTVVAPTTIRASTVINNTMSVMTTAAQITVIAPTSTLIITSSAMTTASTTPTPTNDTIPLTNAVHPTATSMANNTAPTTTFSLIPTNSPTDPTTDNIPVTTSLASITPETTGTLLTTPTMTSTNALTTIHTQTTRTSPTTSPTTPTPTTITAPADISTPPAPVTPAVRSLRGELSVHCRVAAITVSIAKDFLVNANIPESALYLGLVGCGVNGDNSTHVQLTVAWNECNTVLVQNETDYTASVTLFNSMDSYISEGGEVKVPRLRLEVPIMCTYAKSMLISADFGSTGYDMIQEIITGFGSFQVRVQLMNGTAPLPQNYSLSPEEAVVVEVSLNTSSEQIKLVINRCWATATRNPVDVNSYTFLENSCSQSTFTKVLTNGNSSTSRVSVQIFSIVSLDVIYLHCQVQICLQIGADSCVPDCRQRTARSGKTVGRTFGSVGPIFKTDEGETLDEELDILQIVGFSCLGIGLSLFFIIGFICLFFYQRNRIGHYNFNIKPKEENFTYLVFNT